MLSLTQTEQEARTLAPEARVHWIAERILALTGASGSAVALRDAAGVFVCRARAGEAAPRIGAPLNIEAGISGACIRHAEVIRCEDAWKDDRVDEQVARKIQVRSVLAVPIFEAGGHSSAGHSGHCQPVGLVQALSARPYAFSVSDLERLRKLALLLTEAEPPAGIENSGPTATAVAQFEEQVAEALPVALTGDVVEVETTPVRSATVTPIFATSQASEPELQHENEPSAAHAVTTEPSEPHQATTHVAQVIEFPAPVVVEPVVVEPAAASAQFGEEELPTTIALVPDARQGLAPLALEPTLPGDSPLLFQAYGEPTRPRRGKWLLLVAALVLLAGAAYWWTQHSSQASQLFQSLVTRGPLTSGVAVQATPALAAPSARVASSPLPSSPLGTTPTIEATNGAVATQTPASTAIPASLPATVPAAPAGPALPLHVPSAGPRSMSGIHVSVEAGRTVVLLDLNDQVQYEEHRLTNPDRIYFDLQETTVGARVSAKMAGDGLRILRVRTASSQPGVTRVVLDTKGIVDYRVRMNTEPYGLRIEVGTAPRDLPNAVAAAPHPGSTAVAAVPHPLRKIPGIAAAKLKIVLDPGHGGWDMGTIGNRGLMEKDLALDVAQRLSLLLLKSSDYDVTLTRLDDTYIPLEQRASAANTAGADLFISIHGNYSSRSHSRGVETYYPIASSTDAATSVRTEDSRKLAEMLQTFLHHQEAASNPGLPDRGVKGANFAVLRSTAMPAALAEVSFVSSPNDEIQLIQSSYRQQLAEALYKGIASYVSQRNQKLTASASSRASGQ